jgi:uncharacterized protein (TIGR02246 family)
MSTQLAAEEDAIQAVDAELVAALNARDIDRWLRCFAADARMMPPGAPPVAGKEAIREFIAELLTIPNFSVARHLETVEVSRSGDLAWVSYSYELTIRDDSGHPFVDRGKDVTVYRKADGDACRWSWTCGVKTRRPRSRSVAA